MNTKGSINTRLKTIESRYVPKNEDTELVDECDFEDLLFVDYEEYRKVFVEWIMALYMENEVEFANMRNKLDELNETLTPITNFDEFDFKEYTDLLVKLLVDWLEANGIEDLDYDKWEALTKNLDENYS